MEIALGIVLVVLSVLLSVAVLAQSGKDKGMGGALGGGSETFFGKQKGKTFDKILSKATVVGASVFAVLVLLMYVMF